jgi:hypothetical protein
MTYLPLGENCDALEKSERKNSGEKELDVLLLINVGFLSTRRLI